MDLSIGEAAALLRRSQRTVRAQVARGAIPGFKQGGRWRIPRDTLPLDEAQQRALQSKADAIRAALESALPSRTAKTRGQRMLSMVDLDPFRAGHTLLTTMRQVADSADIADGPAGVAPACREVEAGLLTVGCAHHHFALDVKIHALTRARDHFSRAAAALLIATSMPPPEPVLSWVVTLEGEILPLVAGLLRWAEKLAAKQGKRGQRR